MSALGAAISGLQSSQKWLDVISNNVSNSNTVAYKAGRLTFADLISEGFRSASAPSSSSNLGGINPNQVGLGVTVGSVQTIMKQGALQTTGNVTDIAINGTGFLTVRKGAQTLYTRAGNLTFDQQGNLVTSDGGQVQGWQLQYQRTPAAPGPMTLIAGVLDTTNTSAISNIRIPNNLALAPLQTSNQASVAIKDQGVIIKGNLDSNTPQNTTYVPGAPLAVGEIPDAVSSFVVYDSLGTAYPMTMYWFQTQNTPTVPAQWAWKMFYTPAGTTPVVGATFPTPGGLVADSTGAVGAGPNNPSAGDLIFNPDGSLANNGSGNFANVDVSMVLTNGAVTPFSFSLNFGTPDNPGGLPPTYGLRDGVTSDYGNGTFDPITGIYQPVHTIATSFVDGYPEGTLLSLSFNATGGIDATFSNGQTVEVAKLALTKFDNQDGLEKVGGNYFQRTANSGLGQVGVAGTSGFGTITGGALEASNVDLTVELTNMILAQRMFESNARVVTAADRVLDALVNLGR
jgi:flagellar hook protein FlgE